jgi:hypothetical protein
MAAPDSVPGRKVNAETHHGHNAVRQPAIVPKPTQPGILLPADAPLQVDAPAAIPVSAVAKKHQTPEANDGPRAQLSEAVCDKSARSRANKKEYPVAKKYEPPDISADAPAVLPGSANVEPKRRGKKVLLICIPAALVLVLCLVLLGRVLFGGSRISDKEATSMLDNLRVAQRTWWDNEGLAKGSKDPEGALARLQDKQRGWFENEGLAKDGDRTGAAALAHLEEMQRDWLEREGLNKGTAPKDPAGAQSRLQDLNKRWWNGEGLAKANLDTGDSESSSDTAASQADLADLKVKLLEKAGTKRFLESGGTQQSEEAVQLGLQWLAAQQHQDGSWTTEGGGGRRKGGSVTTTAMALLPFLARGETHKGSEAINVYTKQVERGIKFLIDHQKADGDLRGGSNMYTHALATIALCEDLGMTADPMLKGPCQKAIDFLLRAQAKDGGWRYGIAPPQADLSVSSWCLMALKSGQMAGITVPRETLDKATQFLQHVSRPDGGYGYMKGSPGHSPPQPAVMTAAGIVCRQYLVNQSGSHEDSRGSEMMRGVDIITKNPPRPGVKNYYYWYYATYALLPVGGDAWKQWNPQVRDLIVSLQNKSDSNLKGSWDPQGAYQLTASGRVGVTALALLTLEVYYRHLPLNRPELGEMAKDLSKTVK